MTVQYIAFHASLAALIVAALLLPASAHGMRLLLICVTAALMLAVPAIGAAVSLSRPVPDGYWHWVWLLSVIGMPAGYAMAITVVPSIMIRPTRGNYTTEALISLALMGVGLYISTILM